MLAVSGTRAKYCVSPKAHNLKSTQLLVRTPALSFEILRKTHRAYVTGFYCSRCSSTHEIRTPLRSYDIADASVSRRGTRYLFRFSHSSSHPRTQSRNPLLFLLYSFFFFFLSTLYFLEVLARGVRLHGRRSPGHDVSRLHRDEGGSPPQLDARFGHPSCRQ